MITMASTFMPMTQQQNFWHRATICTLWPPSILYLANDFHMADEDKAIQDTVASKMLWHPPQTVKRWFWTPAIYNDWWENPLP